MDAKRDELLRLVKALSGACKQDRNVLKDGELVDMLETRGRQIARLRKQQKKMKKAHQKLNMSPVHGGNKTAKKLKEQVRAGERKAAEAIPKRRKLSLDGESKPPTHGYSHDLSASCMFPSIERQQKPKRESMDEWISSLQGSNAASMNPTDSVAYYRPTTPTTVAVAVEVSEESVMVNPLKTYPYNHMRRSVSPQLKTPRAVRAPSPLMKPISRSVSPTAVDLSASSTSTMASYYDDMYDEYAVSPEILQRYARSASDRAPSFESMDWSPSDDDSSDESMPFRSIADDMGGNFAADEGEPTAESSSHIPQMNASSTEVVMEVLYRIMEHNENFKWLIDPVNQARVAKLVDYQLQEQQNSGASSSCYDDELFINELRVQVDELIHENLRIKSENVRLMGRGIQSAAEKNVEELEKRLALSEEAVSLQEGYRRKAEAVFQSELESKSKLVSSLQHDLEVKDSQITSLMQSGMSGDESSDAEVSRLRSTVLEKDREICRLNIQLSTKQKLVDEIAKKVVQQLETSVKGSSDETVATLTNDLHLDMDMLLFNSVAEKEQVIDELKAALMTMEREVSGLETRVAKKARESLLLKTKFKSLSSRLTEANVNMSRLETENGRLVTSLKEKQAKMRDLIEFLEGKEQQVMHLEEQVNLRQTQLEHVMTEYETMQSYKTPNGLASVRAA
ncbi:hypothetical protein JM18_004041 [Phytophthora kernoviae]|uniref:Uncharacterized protein n=2 Tax=Phytophthora kernoviae TaxID=325452 RepID=A0A8T0LWC3_9STRA|nr:hypothetical protein G195_006661 [Phytophthora kernoviae 00238/432]KAG2522712.1 hypothetical protein JM16_005713 [Phytophthora kernoviae]KAG2524373.1 hypothetical protein JM18_004041 [Phytophthora kernoviae]